LRAGAGKWRVALLSDGSVETLADKIESAGRTELQQSALLTDDQDPFAKLWLVHFPAQRVDGQPGNFACHAKDHLANGGTTRANRLDMGSKMNAPSRGRSRFKAGGRAVSSDEAVPMITLEILAGLSRGHRRLVHEASVTLGRAPHNHLVLPDAHLSSEHGQIFREGDGYVYKDLRSTNGSRVLRRDGSLVYVDASQGFEVLLHDGDQLLLGDPVEPVVLSCLIAGSAAAQVLSPPEAPGLGSPTLPAIQLGRPVPPQTVQGGKVRPALAPEPEESDEAQVLARRSLSEAEAVAGKAVSDPALAGKLLSVSKRLGRRGLDLQSVFEGIAEAVFELVPLCTHIAIELSDGTDGRMATVFGASRKPEGKSDGKPEGKPEGKVEHKPIFVSPAASSAASSSPAVAPVSPVRASRAIIRRVLSERAAVLVANAPQDLAGAASIMGARIQSIMGLPLWDGEEIRGVIQCDNRASAAMFRERDLEALLVLCGQATLAIENARLLAKAASGRGAAAHREQVPKEPERQAAGGGPHR
jgi:hypothetical protein